MATEQVAPVPQMTVNATLSVGAPTFATHEGLRAFGSYKLVLFEWDAVDGAFAYDLEVNGRTFSTTGRQLEIRAETDTIYKGRVRSVARDGQRGEWTGPVSVNTVDVV